MTPSKGWGHELLSWTGQKKCKRFQNSVLMKPHPSLPVKEVSKPALSPASGFMKAMETMEDPRKSGEGICSSSLRSKFKYLCMLWEQQKQTTSGVWEKMQELQWFHPLRNFYVPGDACAHDSDDSIMKNFLQCQHCVAAQKGKRDTCLVWTVCVSSHINMGAGIPLSLFIHTPKKGNRQIHLSWRS